MNFYNTLTFMGNRFERAKLAAQAEDVKAEEMADGPSLDNLPPGTTGKQNGRLDNTLKPEKKC